MTREELDKYVGCQVSFDIAIIPPPWHTDTMDNDSHYEGTLIRNNGRLSHYAIKEYGGLAIRDDFIGLIINFKVMKGDA